MVNAFHHRSGRLYLLCSPFRVFWDQRHQDDALLHRRPRDTASSGTPARHWNMEIHQRGSVILGGVWVLLGFLRFCSFFPVPIDLGIVASDHDPCVTRWKLHQAFCIVKQVGMTTGPNGDLWFARTGAVSQTCRLERSYPIFRKSRRSSLRTSPLFKHYLWGLWLTCELWVGSAHSTGMPYKQRDPRSTRVIKTVRENTRRSSDERCSRCRT